MRSLPWPYAAGWRSPGLSAVSLAPPDPSTRAFTARHRDTLRRYLRGCFEDGARPWCDERRFRTIANYADADADAGVGDPLALSVAPQTKTTRFATIGIADVHTDSVDMPGTRSKNAPTIASATSQPCPMATPLTNARMIRPVQHTTWIQNV